ncbi:MAG TPA: hypothetical protein VNX66_03970 [Candidatus Sulfotelmatobacter sp.]|jgi:hypothetical protein|nr:hypothetical protein [Candidatus Sulfotelmatobacter sp.]
MTTLENVLHEVEQREKELAALSKLWEVTVGEHTPSTVQFSTWLSLHGFAAVVEGIRVAGRKFQKMDSKMGAIHLVRFTSSVMNFRRGKAA